jgi:hypothetical protein
VVICTKHKPCVRCMPFQRQRQSALAELRVLPGGLDAPRGIRTPVRASLFHFANCVSVGVGVVVQIAHWGGRGQKLPRPTGVDRTPPPNARVRKYPNIFLPGYSDPGDPLRSAGLHLSKGSHLADESAVSPGPPLSFQLIVADFEKIKTGSGGAKRDRTADLLNAIQALSQLSYGPTRTPPGQRGAWRIDLTCRRDQEPECRNVMTSGAWHPSDDAEAASNVTAYVEWLRASGRDEAARPDELDAWAARHPASHASALADFLGLRPRIPPAANLWRRRGPADALVLRGELSQAWSWDDLRSGTPPLPDPIGTTLRALTWTDLLAIADRHLRHLETRPDQQLFWTGPITDPTPYGALLFGASLVLAGA